MLLGFMEGANNRYVIPVYQRKYDWKIENCSQLYEDLKKIIRKKRSSHTCWKGISEDFDFLQHQKQEKK
jgi:uncharacterized protein with ParB-like and HNH nuclease domain